MSDDPILAAWEALRVANPAGLQPGVRGLLEVHATLEYAWLEDRIPSSDRVIQIVQGRSAERTRERSAAIERVNADQQRRARTLVAQGPPDTKNPTDGVSFLDKLADWLNDPVEIELRKIKNLQAREDDLQDLERLNLPPEPFDYSWLCRELGQRISHLSPLLATFYLRQAISSHLDFLIEHQDRNISQEDMERWYSCVLKILRVQHDYEPRLSEHLNLDECLTDINAVFAEALEEMKAAYEAQHSWDAVLTSHDLNTKLLEICTGLAADTRSIADYISRLDADSFQAELDRISASPTNAADADDVDGQYTQEQRQQLWRITTSRQVANATFDLLAGRPEDALRRCMDERFFAADSGLEEGEDRAELLRYRLLVIRAEARDALGIEPVVDDVTAGFMSRWCNAFFANWLDQPHAATWWEDGEDPGLSLEAWLNGQPQLTHRKFSSPSENAFESGAVAESLMRDYVTRLTVLSRGNLITSLAGLGFVHSTKPDGSGSLNAAVMLREGLRLIEEMRPVVNDLRPTASRLDLLVDVTLDIKYDQRTILGIMSAAGEDRIARADAFLRACVPEWDSLHEDSRKDLLQGELGYRAFVAGEVGEAAARQVANSYAVAAEREQRRARQLPPFWSDFFDILRTRADHPDPSGFGAVELERMRSYLFGLATDREGIAPYLARSVKARKRR